MFLGLPGPSIGQEAQQAKIESGIGVQGTPQGAEKGIVLGKAFSQGTKEGAYARRLGAGYCQ